MSIFHIYSLALCWGFKQQCNHEICTTTLFFITKYWVGKRYCVPPVQKLGRTCPPFKLAPMGVARGPKGP